MPTFVALMMATQLAAGSGDLLLRVGDQAPPFAMRDLERTVFSLRDYTGDTATKPKKAVLMVFFATWCKPCVKEISIIKRVHSRWSTPGRDVEVLYVGLSQGASELAPFAKQKSLPWRVIPDSFGLLARRYGAGQLPHLFVIDRQGKVAFQHRGIATNLQEVLEAQLALVTGVEAPEEGATPVSVGEPRFDTTYVLGRAPAGRGVVSHWQPLGAYLSETAGAQVEITTEESYATFQKALRVGKYDIANAGPVLCHEVGDQYEPVAKLERQGSPTYFGIIFTQRRSVVRSLADLEGKSLGLVSKHSASGGLYPQLALLDAGLRPKRDVRIEWLGDHAAVAKAVQAGRVDAGACFEDCRDMAWPSTRDKATATRVLTYTADIPAEMILVRRSLPAAAKKKLIAAILGLDNEPGILQQISEGETTVTAVVPASEEDLGSVSEALARVKKGKPRRK